MCMWILGYGLHFDDWLVATHSLLSYVIYYVYLQATGILKTFSEGELRKDAVQSAELNKGRIKQQVKKNVGRETCFNML